MYLVGNNCEPDKIDRSKVAEFITSRLKLTNENENNSLVFSKLGNNSTIITTSKKGY